jgi:hypothetical protein
MKRTLNFVTPIGTVVLETDGGQLSLPVVPGILKHPRKDQLAELLLDSDVARKYTREALRKAPSQVLSHFPAWWLRVCLEDADIPESRRRALVFLLDPGVTRLSQPET